MNAYEVIKIVRGLIGDSSAGHWSQHEVLSSINRAYTWAWLKLVMSSGDWFLTYADVTPVAGVATLPADCFSFVYVEEAVSKAPVYIGQSVRVKRCVVDGRPTSDYYQGFFIGNTLVINCATYTTQLRIWYNRRLVPLHGGTAGDGSGSTVLEFDNTSFPSRVDDAYNNETVEIVSGTGDGIVSTISDYDGSDRYATIVGTAASGDFYGTTLQTPQEANNVIPLLAAIELICKPTSLIGPEQAASLSYNLNRQLDAFEMWRNIRMPQNVDLH